MRNVSSLFAALAFVLISAVPVMAADGSLLAEASFAPLGMGITVLGIGVGLGLIGMGAMGGIARQPEQAGNIRTTMLIIGGLVEGAGIISLVLCLVAK